MGPERAALVAVYERYLACCNEHRFDALGELVVYRFADGKIVQCWGDLFAVVRDALSRAS